MFSQLSGQNAIKCLKKPQDDTSEFYQLHPMDFSSYHKMTLAGAGGVVVVALSISSHELLLDMFAASHLGLHCSYMSPLNAFNLFQTCVL